MSKPLTEKFFNIEVFECRKMDICKEICVCLFAFLKNFWVILFSLRERNIFQGIITFWHDARVLVASKIILRIKQKTVPKSLTFELFAETCV